jgi:hypothetical protein
MTIKDGELASADEVLNLTGTVFKNQAQLLYNAARIGFNSNLNCVTGIPATKNLKYDCMLTDTASTKTNFDYYSTGDYYFPSTATNSGASDTLYNPDSASNPTYAFDMNASTSATKTASISGSALSLGTTFSAKYVGMVYVNASVTVNSASGRTCYIALKTYNGSTWSTVSTLVTGGSSASFNGMYPLNASVQGIAVEMDGSADTTVDFNATWTDITYGPSAATSTLIFQTTSLPTITDCIATWNSSIDSQNTLTVSISADGTNYEEVTDATIHRFTNTGTNLYVKFVIARTDTTAIDKISEYAVLYNTGAA